MAAAELRLGQTEHQKGGESHQGGIEEGGPRPGQGYVVGDEGPLGMDDGMDATDTDATDNTNNTDTNNNTNTGSVLDDAGNAVGDAVDDIADGVSNVTDDVVGNDGNGR